jgi:hypothetical protein
VPKETGYTRTTANNQNSPSALHHVLQWLDGPSEDRFQIESKRVITSDDFARILLRDLSPAPPDAVAVGSGNLTGTPITTAPNLSLFSSVIVENFYQSYDNAGALEGQVDFTITSITLVPEPSTALLLATGLLGLAAHGRRKRA